VNDQAFSGMGDEISYWHCNVSELY